MTEQSPLHPEILPPQETPEIHGPVSEGPQVAIAKKTTTQDIIKKFTPLIVIFLILFVILAVSSLATRPTNPIQPVVTLTPTPTGVSVAISSKSLNYFATESAFLQFEGTIDALPRVIQGAVLQDPTALPPVLDLKLGFSN